MSEVSLGQLLVNFLIFAGYFFLCWENSVLKKCLKANAEATCHLYDAVTMLVVERNEKEEKGEQELVHK